MIGVARSARPTSGWQLRVNLADFAVDLFQVTLEGRALIEVNGDGELPCRDFDDRRGDPKKCRVLDKVVHTKSCRHYDDTEILRRTESSNVPVPVESVPTLALPSLASLLRRVTARDNSPIRISVLRLRS